MYSLSSPLSRLFQSLSAFLRRVLIISQILLVTTPSPKQTNTVLDRVDGVADNGEDDEEDDYYDCNHNIAFDHFGWVWAG